MTATLALLAVTPTVHADEPLPDDHLVEPRNAGGGVAMGTIDYTGALLPKAAAVCARNLTFTLGNGDDSAGGWQSQAFVVNTVISGYAGPVTISGGGHSNTSCESYSLGGGRMTVELTGFNNLTEAKLSCEDIGDPSKSSSLSGQYTRVLTDLTVVLTGRCLVNDFATGVVTFVGRIQATPSDLQGGEGYQRSVKTMTTNGVFELAPL